MFVLIEVVPESVGIFILGLGLIVTAVLLRSSVTEPIGDKSGESRQGIQR